MCGFLLRFVALKFYGRPRGGDTTKATSFSDRPLWRSRQFHKASKANSKFGLVQPNIFIGDERCKSFREHTIKQQKVFVISYDDADDEVDYLFDDFYLLTN